MVDSNSADCDGAYPGANQPQEDCKGCGTPTGVDDLAEGYCYMCIDEDLVELDDLPDDAEVDGSYGDVYGDDDSDPRGR